MVIFALLALVALVALYLGFFGLIIQWAWNLVLVPVAHLESISLAQGVAIFVVINIIGGAFKRVTK